MKLIAKVAYYPRKIWLKILFVNTRTVKRIISRLKEKGIVLLNKKDGVQIPQLKNSQKIFDIPAEKIALEIIGKPFANTPLLGAFAKVSGEVKLESILEAVRMQFSLKKEILDKNLEVLGI